MNDKAANFTTLSERSILDQASKNMIDPLGRDLAQKVCWKYLEGISKNDNECYPIAITGRGNPLLLLHGFDSSFLEFRRLVPLLSNKNKLYIPDLFGFGFCPRSSSNYGLKEIINHINAVINLLPKNSSIGIIGASMGGGIAMEIARQLPKRINRMLLLSPAGLIGKSVKVCRPLDKLGVWILQQKYVRKNLCKQAFANPQKSVGPPEEEIASIHLNIEGWAKSLATFARSGGVSNTALPLPDQPTKVIWGRNDRILNKTLRDKCKKLILCSHEELNDCGHLPHLDNPKFVSDTWNSIW